MLKNYTCNLVFVPWQPSWIAMVFRYMLTYIISRLQNLHNIHVPILNLSRSPPPPLTRRYPHPREGPYRHESGGGPLHQPHITRGGVPTGQTTAANSRRTGTTGNNSVTMVTMMLGVTMETIIIINVSIP